MATRLRTQERLPAYTLTAGALSAVVWSTWSWSTYNRVLGATWQHLSLRSVTTNGLLTVFFFAIGMECSRERSQGALRDWRHAIRPTFGAVGGMLGTALVSLALGVVTGNRALLAGWGVPMATDIAFVVGACALIPGLPRDLRLFLLALAVVDDIGSMAILGATTAHHPRALGLLMGLVVVTIAVRLRPFCHPLIIASFVVPLWAAFDYARIEPALAGAIAGFIIPWGPLHRTLERGASLLSQWAVLPLFALGACGVWWSGLHASVRPLDLIGLVVVTRIVGKIVGIAVGVTVASRCGAPPTAAFSIPRLIGMGSLCAMGFTVPLLFAANIFGSTSGTYSAIGVGLDAATLVGGGLGIALLRRIA